MTWSPWRRSFTLVLLRPDTTVIEWSPGLVVFELDGNEVGSSTVRIPDTPMHWVLQTETRLSGGSPADSVSGHVQVDWVAIWSYDPSITAASAPPTAPAGPALPLAKRPLHVELRRRDGAQ